MYLHTWQIPLSPWGSFYFDLTQINDHSYSSLYRSLHTVLWYLNTRYLYLDCFLECFGMFSFFLWGFSFWLSSEDESENSDYFCRHIFTRPRHKLDRFDHSIIVKVGWNGLTIKISVYVTAVLPNQNGQCINMFIRTIIFIFTRSSWRIVWVRPLYTSNHSG